MQTIDMAGRRYGQLVGVRRLENRGRDTVWLFRCDCGSEVARFAAPVRYGRQISCGCRIGQRPNRLTHGHSTQGRTSPEFNAWQSAKGRCHNPRNHAYADYGGRGICMAPEWRASFERFLADMGPRPAGTSLDRIDNSRGYEPGNCRWATRWQQARNKRSNVLVEFEGEVMPLVDFVEVVGVPYKRLSGRMREKGESAYAAAAAMLANQIRKLTSVRAPRRPPRQRLDKPEHQSAV